MGNEIGGSYPYFLIRISSKEYIENLYYRGEIYMNTVDYYRRCDDNLQIGDDLEGPSYYLGPSSIFFKGPNGLQIPINIENLKVRFVQNINLYCLFGITPLDLNLIEQNISLSILRGLGDYMCIITDPRAFIHRVSAGLEKLGYNSYICRKVKYFSSDYNGEITPYMKRDIYEHQHEIRFVVSNIINQPIKLEIGSIEDISIILPFDEKGCIQFSHLSQ